MPAAAELVVSPDATGLAEDIVSRLIQTLARGQRQRGYAGLALTGGSILEAVFAAIASDPARESIAWDKVDVFWGDERFVPFESDERNSIPARRLLIDPLEFDPARVHYMPASDGPDADLGQAAAQYADTLRFVASSHLVDSDVPIIDVALIGVGPDGHCCSLFPHHPALDEPGTVVAVRDSPKPPPLRLSFSFATLEACAEVWVIASGDSKAHAVAAALGVGDRAATPSAGARGRDRTLWLVDQAAASTLS
jgi:6-phosphogluconolactonase